ncbi:PREDICTED: BPI fold-containing family B member 1 [Elephantulus edwardii]|uniref:BPI fold-containing family B member 1 n=1 Tax=Elephantulus edwardii TaxID=28737 RepID=UPI0003F0647C|nr:PREDICTED: BPI fold-containing family B member 1 [Elephantulus edwardii]
MAGPWTFLLTCALLTASSVQATLGPPAVLTIGPEVIKEKFTQALKDHNAVNILQQLPLLSAVREEPARGFVGSIVGTILKYIVWLKVTSASILQLQVEPLASMQEIVVRVPMDMVAGFNTPLIPTIVEMHMKTEAQAIIHVERNNQGLPHLVLSDCSNSQGSLSISLLHKLSFLVNPLADKVMNLLMPALPKLVKSKLCPVMEAAFQDMYTNLLHMVKTPVSLGFNHLEFDLLFPAIDYDIHLNLKVKLLDSQGKMTGWFNTSSTSITVPTLNNDYFSFVVRLDVVNAAVAALLPPEELAVLLDYVLPELARELKTSLKVISEKAAAQLGPTQIVKIFTQDTPIVLLTQDGAKLAQQVVFEVFATNEVRRPFFTLGIEANSEAQFYTKGDQLILNLNEINIERIQLMNTGISDFNPELLKGIITDILVSVLLPNENGKLRFGIPIPMVKAFGFEEAALSMTKDSLVITPSPHSTQDLYPLSS